MGEIYMTSQLGVKIIGYQIGVKWDLKKLGVKWV